MKIPRATKTDIAGFLAEKRIAVAGLSRSGQAMSNSAFKELKDRGYEVFPVNPQAAEIGGERCYKSLSELSGKVGAVIAFTQPSVTASVVKDAAAAGLKRIWIQQGAESEAALAEAKAAGMNAIAGQCILMHLEPVGALHRFHRSVNRLFGLAPS
jgi:predicted CoA-binding protein